MSPAIFVLYTMMGDPMTLLTCSEAPIGMFGTIVARPVSAIMATTRTVGIRNIRVVVLAQTVQSRRSRARIGEVHVEGQVVGLQGSESGGVVDAQELGEEAFALPALDVASAAARVGVCV